MPRVQEMKKVVMRVCLVVVVLVVAGAAGAMSYPGPDPGRAECRVDGERAELCNAVMAGLWRLESGRPVDWTVTCRQTGQVLRLGSGGMPVVVLADGRRLEWSRMELVEPCREAGGGLSAGFVDEATGLGVRWSAWLEEGSNAIIESVELKAGRDVGIEQVVLIDGRLEGVRQEGRVAGSVVVCGSFFLAVEHPLADNVVGAGGRVRCSLSRGKVLRAGRSRTYSAAVGVVPAGQLRRGFLYYLERRRAHPYRPFLHYNNWYDVRLARPMQRVTEAEFLEAVELYGRHLVRDRGVKMDGFVLDDGWDDFNTLWSFHGGFPDGLKKVKQVAARYGAGLGLWLSPWGGYGPAKQKRLAMGRARGYEINGGGFSMAGPKYRSAFERVCLDMMRRHGVVFFKFDGMGGGNVVQGAGGERADDIDAVLDLTRRLRRADPRLYISATVGTWPSPFWLLYADSIWRQGGDTGFLGAGDSRQQWITYRDACCYKHIVRAGRLYPLNALMLHGPCLADRRNPARMARDEKSLADEIWSFFGSGTGLQELYIDPHLPTERMWDELAAAARWARANRSVLVDTHWVGGDPAEGQVYGWASWQEGKGILVLRNPAGQGARFRLEPRAALELPAGRKGAMRLKGIYPADRALPAGPVQPDRPLDLELEPFEVVVIELHEEAGRDEGPTSRSPGR